ncbi:MAG: Hemolysin-type calcium-binding protein [Rhodospirillales bacterium]|nr:Hemolysin-type calcium-binding protein [Rhodospirillales bacterium]
MVDTALFPAMRAAIRQNELGNASPYRLSYARLGQSGASFGIFQGDTNVNPLARSTLSEVLNAAGIADAIVGGILAAVSRPLPEGCPLSPADTALADGALAAPFGQAIVDRMDDQLMQTVLNGIDSCLAASGARPIDPVAQLYLALWINMTGAPTTLAKWLGGTTEAGLAPPDGATVSAADLENYLQASAYFRENPRNFAHMQASVAAGTVLLPTVEAAV